MASGIMHNPEGWPNSLARTPPMGWRSWSAFGGGVNQKQLERIVDALTVQRLRVGGKLVSLKDVGYDRIGLDDGWDLCGAGANGTYRNVSSGHVLVNTTRTPSLARLTAYAHVRGVKADWYLNNDGPCREGPFNGAPHYTEDTADVLRYGFSHKYDDGGVGMNITERARRDNLTGRPLLIENVLTKAPKALLHTPSFCPYSLFRTGTDVSPSLLSALFSVYTGREFFRVSRPGCWAFPDSLEVGAPAVGYQRSACAQPRMSASEARAQFGLWCVLSSPLFLGFDVSNMTEYDAWFPLITHEAALAIHRAWAGEAGHLVAASARTLTTDVPVGAHCEGTAKQRSLPAWTVWGKALEDGSFALTAINLGPDPVDIELEAHRLGRPGLEFPRGAHLGVTDVWRGGELPTARGVWAVRGLAHHASVLHIVRRLPPPTPLAPTVKPPSERPAAVDEPLVPAKPPPLVPPLGPMSVSSFYGFDPPAQHGWTNLILYGPNSGTVQAQLDAFSKYRIPSLYGNVAGVFNRTSGTLHPDWEAQAESLANGTLLPHFGEGKAFRGVFLGDEICCADVDCYAASLAPVAAKFRALLGPRAILATNECALDPSPGGFPDIPPDFDLFSIDTYAGFLPGTHGKDEAAQAKWHYERQVFPKLRPHQKALLIPGTFGCSNLTRAGVPLAVQSKNVVEKLEAYWAWAKTDTRIAGFAPWHLEYRGGDQAPASRCDMQLGAQNFSDVMRTARRIGRAIVRA